MNQMLDPSKSTAVAGAFPQAFRLSDLLAIDRHYGQANMISHCGLVDWDVRANSVYCCPLARQMLHLRQSRLDNGLVGLANRIHPRDRERFRQDLKGHLEGRGKTLHGEYRVLAPDASHRWFLFRGLLLRDRDGQAQRLLGLLADITSERDQAA